MLSEHEIPDMPQVHQWTHGDERVLLVKCVGPGGKSHNGFLWPKSGSVKPQNCAQDSDCDTGGLFGWPWGVRLGGGRQIAGSEATEWIVFAANPGQVFDCVDKAKVAAKSPEEVDCEVVYYGTLEGALRFTEAGRSAYLAKWIEVVQKRSRGAASATGWRGAASATGESGAASATGERGAASATGESGAASATGWSGAASATGWSGAASATGWSGAASATGESGAASATGERGAASATGWGGAASATGWSGAASATGERGAASATGWSGAASATGRSGAASLTGELGTLEVGPNAVGVVTARQWKWVVRPMAVVLCRWQDGDKWPHKTLAADELGLADGSVVNVVCGEIAKDTK